MSRYVVLSFAFMGMAFYEMSGGADFEPGPNTTAAALGFEPRKPDVTRIASRADTSGTPLTGVSRVPAPKADAQLDEDPPMVLATLETPTVARGAQEAEKTAMFAQDSVEAPVAESVEAGLSDPDLRRVDGSRVNLRSGPGTTYSVVTRLGKGEPVEVLQNTGDGWLELRVVETDRIGWMADFLVTASSE